ncbi:MAG: DUF1800 domain-containing protein, partial [Planctomycetota bacterium]|nr:DUF1800 domain-containing protein [Planctomycetota bacterium]
NRLSGIEPPDTQVEHGSIAVVRSVYARRQLEQQTTLFYSNHFNTDFQEVRGFYSGKYADSARRTLEGVRLQHRDVETFRDFAFNANFRDMAWEGVVSPAMLIYLDNDNNIAGRPNENLSREVLELLTMGVDNGYTQTDVEELARVLTGWNVCKKQGGAQIDPLGACVPDFVIDTPAEPITGGWVRNFRIPQHDCEAKTLFAGTAYETVIPDTCDGLGDPTSAGLNDLDLALDAIVDHPSTAEFLTTKLLRKFVTEEPTQAMIDAVGAVWNDDANPAGAGDLREVLREVLAQAELMNPDQVGGKVKTPFEHVSGMYRATRGLTNGSSGVRNYLFRMGYLYFENPIPTGYSEIGEDWIGTNNLLERQNFGLDLTRRTGNTYGTDLIGLLQDNGVSTGQGNAEAIVDFFNDALFGGALAPADRQRTIDYLNTDDNGAPSTYDFARIRETVALMLGYAQFLEQ